MMEHSESQKNRHRYFSPLAEPSMKWRPYFFVLRHFETLKHAQVDTIQSFFHGIIIFLPIFFCQKKCDRFDHPFFIHFSANPDAARHLFPLSSAETIGVERGVRAFANH
jgi:hypothetical protein